MSGAWSDEEEAAYDAAYEAHLAAEWASMCPVVRKAEEGFDDPMTRHYGAEGVVADAIHRHMKACQHPWCVEHTGR